jgi:hypothetical protein
MEEAGARAQHLPIVSTWDAQKAATATKEASPIDGLNLLVSDTQDAHSWGQADFRD